VDEEEVDPGSDLVESAFVSEVGAHAPVHLPEDSVVDPRAPGSLEERMAEQQDEPAPGLQYAGDLVDGRFEGVDVLQRQADDDGVEGTVSARQRLGTGAHIPGPTGASASHLHLRGRGIDSHDLCTRAGDASGDLPLAAADVEHPARPLQLAGDEREDLVLVLRIGPVGELPLPPWRVALPLQVVLHSSNSLLGADGWRPDRNRARVSALIRPLITSTENRRVRLVVIVIQPSQQRGEIQMSVGPIEILVISFPGNEFTGEVAPALAELVETGLIRVIDLVFVAKDAAGDVVALELSEIDETASSAFRPHVEEPSGMLAEEDIEDLAADLAPNSSAAILLFEHVWATKFQQAVLNSGGELVAAIRIPKEAVDEILAAN